MIRLFLISFILFSSIKIIAQDSIICNQDLSYRKVGIYKTYDEFLKNEPSINKPLKLVRTFGVDYERNDTSWLGLTYVFEDNSKRLRKIWGFYDGEHVYHFFSQFYCIPINYVGRYCITSASIDCFSIDSSKIRLDTLIDAPASLPILPFSISGIIRFIEEMIRENYITIGKNVVTNNNKSIQEKKKKGVIYFDKYGEPDLLTDLVIDSLLLANKQNDLYNRYKSEKKRNSDSVLIKYLMLLNKRLE